MWLLHFEFNLQVWLGQKKWA